jgi:hypothetical protein
MSSWVILGNSKKEIEIGGRSDIIMLLIKGGIAEAHGMIGAAFSGGTPYLIASHTVGQSVIGHFLEVQNYIPFVLGISFIASQAVT